MSKINIYIYFENPICCIYSVADGQDLNDLIYFDESKRDIRSFYWEAVPRIGETVGLYSEYGIHPFTVMAVHHECHGNGHPQYVLSKFTIHAKK